MRLYYISLFCVVVIYGCSPYPKQLTTEEVNKYDTVSDLIADKVGLKYEDAYSTVSFDGLIKPHSFARDYCESSSGVLNQVHGFDRVELKQGLKNNGRHKYPEHPKKIADAFGLFECVISGETGWGILITHSGVTPGKSSTYVHRTNVIVEELSAALVPVYAQIREGKLQNEEGKRNAAEWKVKRKEMEETAKRNIALDLGVIALSKPSAIGKKICKSGTMNVDIFRNKKAVVVGTLEQHSADSKRIQIRVAGWDWGNEDPDQLPRGYAPRNAPVFGSIVVQRGTIIWEDIYGWTEC